MTEPSLALQKATYSALTTAGLRVYDRVPPDAVVPYVTVGDDQVIATGFDCLDGSSEVYSSVHVWSRQPGKVEAKSIAGTVRSALDNATLDLSANGFALVSILHHETRYLGDEDGLTTHAVVTFHALIDAA